MLTIQALAVACQDIDVRHVRALIVGPPETPYEFGFFEFQVKFGKDYPTKAPTVQAITTNGGRTRFNPNIYAHGKVCLSILGTWRGERGEEWSSAQGLESILISIQSLMSSNPYENEPGFEDAETAEDKKNQEAYVAKIRHETLRISIIERLERYLGIAREKEKPVTVYNAEEDYKSGDKDAAFEPFKDLCKRRFAWYYDSYLLTIAAEQALHKDGEKFEKMPFEGPGNVMDGSFNYTSLKQRMSVIRDALEAEAATWAGEGKVCIENESGIANNLQRQFEQVSEHFKHSDAVSLDLSLVDQNPFTWELILFGRPMTNLDGGMFRFKLFISPKFPDVLPRVKCETPLFHHRVSKDGAVCYDAKRKDDLRSHIDAIVATIEEESPAYDPRTLVNPEAAKLFWGKPEDKKIYNRKLRRSVQESTE